MAVEICNHLSGAGKCTDSQPPGSGQKRVCICRNTAATKVWLRITNVHDASHAQLKKRSTQPPGVEADYDLEHVTGSGTQTGGTIDGDEIDYHGQSVTFRIHHVVAGEPQILSIIMTQPEGC